MQDIFELSRVGCPCPPYSKCVYVEIYFWQKLFISQRIDTPQPKGVRILVSTVLSRYLNASIQISPFGYVHKRTRTARPRLKRFIRFLAFTPTFVQDLGFILPGFRIRSCPRLPTSSFLCALYRYILLSHNVVSLFPNLKVVLQGRGFKPKVLVN